jgi:hypothetical protein
MKKTALIALAVLAVFAFSPKDLAAQTDVSMHWGVITDQNFKFDPFLWTGGLVIDLYLMPQLSLSPEVFATVNNFDFKAFYLSPSVLLNIQSKSFFLGGGITKYWVVGSEVSGAPSSDVMFKANVGLKGKAFKLTFFAVTPFNDFFKSEFFGILIGFYF